ncbi:MAG: DUF4301 family protein [Paludibacteraceae bacterium]|nr:DUF4301 family protein [Paludibacteraceae bacterium]
MFTPSEIKDLEKHQLHVDVVETQLSAIKNGLPELDIVQPATLEKGIRKLDKAQEEKYIALWEEYEQENHHVVKFVPASGAATRMFKELYEFLQTGTETPHIQQVLSHLNQFAFADLLQGKQGKEAIEYILNDLQYGNLPKGLIPFHSYPDGARTPILEHLVEGVQYATSNHGKEVNIHFTIKQSDIELFDAYLAKYIPLFEKKYNVKYNVTHSIQSPSTDTVAGNPDGTPFKDENGNLVYRPGGHGALLLNLNEIDADVIFVKNIDNVLPDKLREDTIRYKKILAGILLEERYRSDKPTRVCGVVKNTGEPGGGPFIVREADGTISYQILEQVQVKDQNLFQKSTHFNPVDLVCSTKNAQGKKYDLTQFVDPNTALITRKSYKGKDLMAYELPGLWNGSMAKWNTIFVEVPITTFSPVKTINDLLNEQHQ